MDFSNSNGEDVTFFDGASVSAESQFAPFPAGIYLLQLDDIELKKTNAGDGHYLKAALSVVEGEHRERKMWTMFTVDNRSSQAIEIGRRELKQLVVACGEVGNQDITKSLVFGLVGSEFVAKVKIRRSDEFGDQNEIAQYLTREGEPIRDNVATQKAPAPASAQSAPTPAAEASGGGKMPWQK